MRVDCTSAASFGNIKGILISLNFHAQSSKTLRLSVFVKSKFTVSRCSQVAIGGYNAAFPNAAEVIGEYRMLTQEESAVARVDSNTTGLQRIGTQYPVER